MNSRRCIGKPDSKSDCRARCASQITRLPARMSAATARNRMPVFLCTFIGARRRLWILFDHLVGAREQRRRYRKAKRLGGLEIKDEVVLCWGLNRQIAWLFALENTIHVT